MTDLAPLVGKVTLEGVETLDVAAQKAKVAERAVTDLGTAASKTSAAMKATDTAGAGLEAHGKAARDAAGAHGELQRQVGLSRNQMLELTHVGKSLFDMLAAGANPIRAVTLESGRLGQIIAGSGGITGTVNAATASFGGMFTASRLAAGGIAGVALASGKAFADYEMQQQRLENSLQGLGRTSGLTLDGLNRVAASGAERGDISVSSARDYAARNNAMGLSGEINADIISISKRYGEITGQDTSSASDELAKAFSEGSKGAEALDKKLGFLDSTTRNLIRTQEASLNPLGAQRTLYTALAGDIEHAADNTWRLEQIWDRFKDKLSNVKSAAGQGIANVVAPTASEMLKERLGEFQQQNPNAPKTIWDIIPNPFSATSVMGKSDATRNALGAALAESLRQVDSEAARAAKSAATLNSATLSKRGDDLINAGDPDIGRLKGLEETLASLRKVAADPGAASKLGGPLQVALADAEAHLSSFSTAAQKVGLDAADSAKITMARTSAERTALEAAKAYNDVIASGGKIATAAAEAEAVRTRAIATAAKTLEDATRGVHDSFLLSQATTPFQRSMLQGQLAERDLARDTSVPAAGTGIGALTAMPAAIQAQILAASQKTGVSASLIAAIGQKENSGRLAGGTTLLGEDGRPSSATGFGQITAGAEKDIRTIMPGFDRTDPSQAVAGTAAYMKILEGRWGSEDAALAHYRGSSNPAVNAAYVASIHALQGGGGTMAPPGTISSTARLAERNATTTNELFNQPLAQAGLDLKAQQIASKAISDNWLKTPGEIAAASKEAELLGNATKNGITLTDQQAKSVHDMGLQYGAAAQAADEFAKHQQAVIGGMDQLRGAAKDTFGGIGTDLAHGAKLTDALTSAVGRLEDRMISNVTDSLVDSLFGKSGTNGAGSLFGGPVASLASSAATTGGGLLQSLFSSASAMFAFADGGVMTSAGSLPLHRYASGGVANSPQLAMFGEGRGPEAYVPLADGRSIPVSMKGGGGSDKGSGAVIQNTITHAPTIQGSGLSEAQTLAVMQKNNEHFVRKIGDHMKNWQRRYG